MDEDMKNGIIETVQLANKPLSEKVEALELKIQGIEDLGVSQTMDEEASTMYRGRDLEEQGVALLEFAQKSQKVGLPKFRIFNADNKLLQL